MNGEAKKGDVRVRSYYDTARKRKPWIAVVESFGHASVPYHPRHYWLEEGRCYGKSRDLAESEARKKAERLWRRLRDEEAARKIRYDKECSRHERRLASTNTIDVGEYMP